MQSHRDDEQWAHADLDLTLSGGRIRLQLGPSSGDLNHLRGRLDVQAERLEATVQTSVTRWDLDRFALAALAMLDDGGRRAVLEFDDGDLEIVAVRRDDGTCAVDVGVDLPAQTGFVWLRVDADEDDLIEMSRQASILVDVFPALPPA